MKTALTQKAAALMAACLGLFAACEKPGIDPLEPNFPDKVTGMIASGETKVIELEPNMAWELKVPEETLDWFWIENDAEETLPSLRGEAGKVTVNLCASARYDLELRTFDVTLTMGGQTKVIYTLTKDASERAMSVYAAKIDPVTGGLSNGSDVGGYEYETEPVADDAVIDLAFDETNPNFSMAFKLVSNLNWALTECPEWVESVSNVGDFVVTGKPGEICPIRLKGVPSKYPLDEALESELQFKDLDKDEVFKTVSIRMKPVGNLVILDLGNAEFNSEGKAKDMNGEYTKDAIAATLTAVDGAEVFALEKQDGFYRLVGTTIDWEPTVYPGMSSPVWVNMELIAGETTTDILVSKTLSVSVEPVQLGRSAEILVLPKSLAKDISVDDPEWCLTTDEGTIKEEYLPYVKGTITQLGEGGATADDLIAIKAGQAVIFEVPSAETDWVQAVSSDFGVSAVYSVTVNSSANIQFDFNKLVNEADGQDFNNFFDESLKPITVKNDWENWFYLDTDNFDGTNATIVVNFGETAPEKKQIGYMVMKNGQGVNVAVLRVVYDPAAEIAVPDLVKFADPDAAAAASATLRRMQATEAEYEELAMWFMGDTPQIYVLTYAAETTDAPILKATADYLEAVPVNPDDGSWLTGEFLGASSYMVTMNTEEKQKQGALMFKDPMNGYKLSFIILCKKDVAN